MSKLLEKTVLLREEALEELAASPAYATFKALDDAVMRMGGVPKLLFEANEIGGIARQIFGRATKAALPENGKRRHGDAAELALRSAREPLPISRLMDEAAEHGAEIGGNDPLNNFRSTVSKDPRFRSLRRNNLYFWWLADSPIPDSFNELAGPDLLTEPASSSADQEGGDGHGPATT